MMDAIPVNAAGISLARLEPDPSGFQATYRAHMLQLVHLLKTGTAHGCDATLVQDALGALVECAEWMELSLKPPRIDA